MGTGTVGTYLPRNRLYLPRVPNTNYIVAERRSTYLIFLLVNFSPIVPSFSSSPNTSRLSDLMNDVIAIHGRGNFPTLEVKLGKPSSYASIADPLERAF